MNVIPALGIYAAMMRRAGKTRLDYPGGVGRVAQAVDADLLARAIAWSGESAAARNEIFNVTNGDVFVGPNVGPPLAHALRLAPRPRPGGRAPRRSGAPPGADSPAAPDGQRPHVASAEADPAASARRAAGQQLRRTDNGDGIRKSDGSLPRSSRRTGRASASWQR